MTSNDETNHLSMEHRGKTFRVWKAGDYWYSRYKDFTCGPDTYLAVVYEARWLIDQAIAANEPAEQAL